MTSYLWLTVLTLALALCVSCQARAASSDDERELIKILNSRADVDIDTHRQNRFPLGHTTSGHHAPSGASASALPLSSIWYHQGPVLISEEGQAMGAPVRHRPYAPAATYADLLSRLRTALPIEVVDEGDSSLEKRYRPSGFQGSRGKRFIPGLQSLLLASYYQDAEKWKRQPHKGFHGTRG
ncbi:uncharacterized protein LOC106054835 isoform X2 [Biomphalaria glabrata]|nr:uncharacterized protein LOC106054835 isoform X2 [Biomphalaria glabrata]